MAVPRSVFILGFVILCGCLCPAQEPEQYQRGTIVAVARHPATLGQEPGNVTYDVSVRVHNLVYVCVYSPPNGANGVEYSVGMDLLVLVKDDTLTFPSKLTGTTTVPIVRTEQLNETPVLDWSKAPAQYFEMKMRNLTEHLDLTAEQQKQIKPILEQEAFDAGEVCFNPVVPRKQWLPKWQKVVEGSDKKMKSILSNSQWSKLQELRSEQKKELKRIISEDSSRSENSQPN